MSRAERTTLKFLNRSKFIFISLQSLPVDRDRCSMNIHLLEKPKTENTKIITGELFQMNSNSTIDRSHSEIHPIHNRKATIKSFRMENLLVVKRRESSEAT